MDNSNNQEKAKRENLWREGGDSDGYFRLLPILEAVAPCMTKVEFCETT